MKTRIITWIIILAILFAPDIATYLQEETWLPNDYARITDVDYKAVVVDEPGSEGKIVVTERLTFDVHAASKNNLFWELWRDLPEDNVDGVKVHYKVNSVKQILPDGTEIVYEESPKLYWDDYDYVSENERYGPEKWYHSEGPYSEALEQYECLMLYADGLYREKIVYEIEYEMYNAVLRYNDCSDLYISLYSGDTTKYLESFNAEICVPNKDMPKIGDYTVTTYGTNANEFPVEESATKNQGYYTFSFNLTEDELKFKPYNDYIEFDLVAFGDSKHSFAENASENYYSNDNVLEEIYEEQEYYKNEPIKFKSTKTLICGICILISLIVLFGSKAKIWSLKNKYKFYSPEREYETFRDIPSDLDPNFAAALVFCKDKKQKDDSCVYSAILLSLARKGYVEISDSSTDALITLTNKEEGDGPFESLDMFDPFDPREPLESLTMCEKYYFDLIKRHAIGNNISMSALQRRVSMDYDYTNSFVENMKVSVLNYGIFFKYFQKANYLEPCKLLSSNAKSSLIVGLIFLALNIITYRTHLDFAFGGFFILGISCLVRWLYLKFKANKYVLLTEFGETEYQKWRGLYNFLKSDTLMQERTVIELPLWEKYLVYATAFGISEKVIEAIKIRCPEKEAETKSIVNNTYCRSGRIRLHGRSFHSSVRSASHHFHSSSSGGGFGYGGGGRGGGGGGGGH